MNKDKNAYSIKNGFTPDQSEIVCDLFWQAFRDKLVAIMKPEDKAIQFFNLVADPNYAISAINTNESLIGVAGYKTHKGSLMGGDLKELSDVYGWFGGLWRGLALSILERPLEPDTLLMDGIFVTAEARGKGVGTALLTAIKRKAAELDCKKVRLDVIDINPRARVLYEREGFVAQETQSIGALRHIFGFQKSTKMIHTL